MKKHGAETVVPFIRIPFLRGQRYLLRLAFMGIAVRQCKPVAMDTRGDAGCATARRTE